MTHSNQQSSSHDPNQIVYITYTRHYAEMHSLAYQTQDELFSGYLPRKQVEEAIGADQPVTGHARPQGYMSVDLTESYRNAFRKEIRAKLGLTKDEDKEDPNV